MYLDNEVFVDKVNWVFTVKFENFDQDECTQFVSDKVLQLLEDENTYAFDRANILARLYRDKLNCLLN